MAPKPKPNPSIPQLRLRRQIPVPTQFPRVLHLLSLVPQHLPLFGKQSKKFAKFIGRRVAVGKIERTQGKEREEGFFFCEGAAKR
jgi:hypothetical protein